MAKLLGCLLVGLQKTHLVINESGKKIQNRKVSCTVPHRTFKSRNNKYHKSGILYDIRKT